MFLSAPLDAETSGEWEETLDVAADSAAIDEFLDGPVVVECAD